MHQKLHIVPETAIRSSIIGVPPGYLVFGDLVVSFMKRPGFGPYHQRNAYIQV